MKLCSKINIEIDNSLHLILQDVSAQSISRLKNKRTSCMCISIKLLKRIS